MVAESTADQRAANIYKQFPEVETTILANAGEVQFHLKARGADQQEAEEQVEKLASLLEDEFADEIFSSGGESLEQIVGYFLQMRGATLSVAESCTGGLLAERITRISGSSRYFMGGALVYSDCVEARILRCASAAAGKRWRSQPFGGRCPRRRHSPALQDHPRHRNHRNCRPHRRHRRKARRTGLHCARRRQAHRSGRAQISRRP